MSAYQRNQKLRKISDKREVTIASVGPDYIVLDGDFEPKHVVMKDKVSSYYIRLDEPK